jgi:hypothetical protein
VLLRLNPDTEELAREGRYGLAAPDRWSTGQGRAGVNSYALHGGAPHLSHANERTVRV